MNDYIIRQTALPVLKEGDTGEYVIILQQKLKILGFYSASITGSFGPYTKEIVINFQKQNKLNPTGIVDMRTWELLYKLTFEEPPNSNRQSYSTIRLGSTGEDVKELQTRLSELMYYDGSINGTFDESTNVAVKTFQINNNLTADGIVGRNTWSALETLYSPLKICNEDSDSNLMYKVLSGDTLYSIAKKFNTTVAELKRINNLNSNIISIGQELIIKPPNTSNIIYTVSSGDTLYSIAKKYNITVDELKNLNNLNNNIISINQKLLIPTTTSSTTYTVSSGDTLYNIAKKYNTTVDEVKKINNLNNNIISIGQKLIIPN